MTPAGFPHSDISGSTSARDSPKLFAACHVLHRLLAPRHPPRALCSLTPPASDQAVSRGWDRDRDISLTTRRNRRSSICRNTIQLLRCGPLARASATARHGRTAAPAIRWSVASRHGRHGSGVRWGLRRRYERRVPSRRWFPGSSRVSSLRLVPWGRRWWRRGDSNS